MYLQESHRKGKGRCKASFSFCLLDDFSVFVQPAFTILPYHFSAYGVSKHLQLELAGTEFLQELFGRNISLNRILTPAHFDLIIIDESHRSIFKKYRAIFEYFDGVMVGLTATPKTDVDRNTYEFFDMEHRVPTYAYDYETAVYQDHVLVPYYNYEVKTKFLEEGIIYYQTIAYPFLLFRQNMVGKRVVLHWNPVSFAGGEAGNLETLRCCAVCTEEGELRVVLINRDFSAPYTVCLGSGKAAALVMTADSPEAVCSKDNCCVRQEQRTVDTEEILLPPGSITLLSKVDIKE